MVVLTTGGTRSSFYPRHGCDDGRFERRLNENNPTKRHVFFSPPAFRPTVADNKPLFSVIESDRITCGFSPNRNHPLGDCCCRLASAVDDTLIFANSGGDCIESRTRCYIFDRATNNTPPSHEPPTRTYTANPVLRLCECGLLGSQLSR